MSAPCGQGKRAPGTFVSVGSSEKDTAEKLAFQGDPLRADEGTSGSVTGHLSGFWIVGEAVHPSLSPLSSCRNMDVPWYRLWQSPESWATPGGTWPEAQAYNSTRVVSDMGDQQCMGTVQYWPEVRALNGAVLSAPEAGNSDPSVEPYLARGLKCWLSEAISLKHLC